MKHTKGPWRVREDILNGSTDIVSSEGLICELPQDPTAKESGNWPITANAHLIAAAPELLEALEIVYQSYSNHGCTDPDALRLMSQVEKAIAKARGEKGIEE